MKSTTSRQVILASRPTGQASIGDFDDSNLEFVEKEIDPVRDSEVRVRNILFSVDPFQRTLMGNTPSEAAVVEIGDVLRGATVGIVEESCSARFAPGDHVVGWLGWRDIAVVNEATLRKLDPNVVPLSTALGVLGHTGLTAWLGSVKLMEPKPGGTFVVTNAAGSVGSLAVQLAKLHGHRVVGIAGGPAKVAYLCDELNVDAAIDYKADTFEADLAAAVPDGIDRLLDSVGAGMFATLMPHFTKGAIATIIGQIAMFGDQTDQATRDNLPELLNLVQYRDIRLRGLQIPDHFAHYPEFLQEVTPLVINGTIKYQEEFMDGFEHLPTALRRLFAGGNSGKLIVRA